jgi:hypothetical protein
VGGIRFDDNYDFRLANIYFFTINRTVKRLGFDAQGRFHLFLHLGRRCLPTAAFDSEVRQDMAAVFLSLEQDGRVFDIEGSHVDR